MLTVTVQDERSYTFGSGLYPLTLTVPARQITAQQLIEARVCQEVASFNQERPDYFCGLIQPWGAERTPQGFRLEQQRPLDRHQQLCRAMDAFRLRGFLLLVNRQQVLELEEVITLGPETEITFLKVLPLVAG